MTTALVTERTQYIIPNSDVAFFKQLAKKMGWTKKRVQKRIQEKKSGLELALEDINKGGLKSFNSIDSLMEYLHS